jgi:hypothetical protein
VPIHVFTELRVTADEADVSDDEIFRKANASIAEIKQTSNPVHCRFGKIVTYVTRRGGVLDEEAVRTRVKVGVPVHYVGTGPNMGSLSNAKASSAEDLGSYPPMPFQGSPC